MVVDLIATGGIVAGAAATIMFGVKRWMHDERERREAAEQRREAAEQRREEAAKEREDRIMERFDRLGAEFEKLRQQRAADREEDLKRWAELMAEVKVIASRLGTVEKKVDGLCAVVEELGKRATALESDFAAFREFVMPLVVPREGSGRGQRGGAA